MYIPLLVFLFFVLMIRRPPRSTRTDTLFPYTTLFRSLLVGELWRQYQVFADRPLASVQNERVLEVKMGDSFRSVLRRMRGIGIDEGRDWQWRALAFELKVLERLQVGEYTVGHGITPRQLLRKLEDGRVIPYRFTLVEGWSLADLRAALAKQET